MKIVNYIILLFVNYNLLIFFIISGLLANIVFIYAYPPISFCIDNHSLST